jgi:SAM-dependent methyltransferase
MTDVSIEHLIHPELAAGGYPRGDHRMDYILRVNALLHPDMVVLDFGAGRGKWSQDPVPLRRWLGDFRGRCARVIGCDVDPEIAENPQVDERLLLAPGATLPLADGSVDLISAFSVLEHVEDEVFWARELDRVLRPGGWLCAWTPNKWGAIALGARLIPSSRHAAVLRRLEPRRHEEDSFPPVYHMNTPGALRRLFPVDRYEHCTYRYAGRPFYHLDKLPVARAWQAIGWLTPPPLKPYMMAFIRKRGGAEREGAWPVGR